MNYPNKHMVIALTLSTLLIIFNIAAVLSGTATNYYNQLEHFIIDF